jgi:transcriptional regulator with XRE-family HTH domain
MKGFGQRLRDRARQLGLADATVAERLGLSQQRYFNYVSDQTEPDLKMLLRICQALDTTPNAVLGTEPHRPEAGEPELLRARIAAAAGTMAVSTLRVTAAVVDVLAREHQPEASSTLARTERGRRPGGPPR